VGIGIVAGLLACVHRAPEVSGAAVLDPATAAADARFAERGADPAALDDAADGWTARLAEDPGDRAVLARLSHAEWLRAMGSPNATEAAAHLANGEEFGWRCLLGVPGVRAAMDAAGGAVPALEDLPSSAAPCLAWTAANALDRVAARGPGAALALGDLGGLVARADSFGDAALAPWDPNGVPGMGAWLSSRWRFLSATDDAARERAREEAVTAVRAGPGFLRWRADALAAWPSLDDALPEIRDAERWSYENTRVEGARGDIGP
jgi:hypothetical protein